jgi:peroxiredoxin
MKNFIQTLLLLLVSITLSMAQVGTNAPNFELDKLGGGKGKLSDHSGKVIYIFWFGYNCPPCVALSPVTKNIVGNYSSSEVKAFGLDVWNGSASQVQNFKSQTGVQYDLLLKAGSTLSAYSAFREGSTVIDQDGVIQYQGPTRENDIKAKIDELLTTTAIEDNNLSPVKFELKNNYPNPFNPETRIPFSVDKTQNIKLEIYNISGQLIRTIVNAPFAKGNFEVTWNGRDTNGTNVASGVYFSRLQGDGISQVKQLLLVK